MTEAFQFERQLMGTFTSLTDGFDADAGPAAESKIDLELEALI